MRKINVRVVPHFQHGFNMVEVLVALLVLSIGMLGLAMLQVRGMQFTNESYFRTQATLIAYDIMDRIRANKGGADAGAYCYPTISATSCTTQANPNVSCGGSGCSDNLSAARQDLTQWYNTIDSTLPKMGTLAQIKRDAVTIGGAGSSSTVYQYTITIYWQEHDTNMSQQWIAVL